jgi:hypothetical protein
LLDQQRFPPMRFPIAGAAALLALAAVPAAADVPVSLRGSPQSMERQHRVAREHALTFARTPAQVRELEARGELVRLVPNEDFGLLESLSHPVSHPVTREFIERTAAGYRPACGERLVVTSLTRPSSRQPANAHPLSVHPTGIAVDLRISQRPRCRDWLERTLLGLEARGVLDVTREQRPPHYHVALFPGPYLAYLQSIEGAPLREPTPLEALTAPAMLMTILPHAPPRRPAPAVAADVAGGAGEGPARGSPWSAAVALSLGLVAVGLLRWRG